MPKMPQGKPAGVACAHLTAELTCELFGLPERPAVCGSLQPSVSMCGQNREAALAYLTELEVLTAPTPPATDFMLAQ
jgi:hypothetical protein